MEERLKRDCGSALTTYSLKVQQKSLEIKGLNGVRNGFHTTQLTTEKHAKYAVALRTPSFNPKLQNYNHLKSDCTTPNTVVEANRNKTSLMCNSQTHKTNNGLVIKPGELPIPSASNKHQRKDCRSTSARSCPLSHSALDVINVPRVGTSASNGERAILPTKVEHQGSRTSTKDKVANGYGNADVQSGVGCAAQG